MVRETRHLWVGNLPETVREDRIREHFKRFGSVQYVSFVSENNTNRPNQKRPSERSLNLSTSADLLNTPRVGVWRSVTVRCAIVSFVDVRSATRASAVTNTIDNQRLTIKFVDVPTTPPPSRSKGPVLDTGSERVKPSSMLTSSSPMANASTFCQFSPTSVVRVNTLRPSTIDLFESNEDLSPSYVDRGSGATFYDRTTRVSATLATGSGSTSGSGCDAVEIVQQQQQQYIRRPSSNSYHSAAASGGSLVNNGSSGSSCGAGAIIAAGSAGIGTCGSGSVGVVGDGRSRTRERPYRNGPFTSVIDKNPVTLQRISNSVWYDSPSPTSNSRTVYGNVASAVVTPGGTCSGDPMFDSSPVSASISATVVSNHMKKNKSRCGSESPVDLRDPRDPRELRDSRDIRDGSASSRSQSRSPSSCSSTNSAGSSNNSHASSSPVSGDAASSRSRNIQSAVSTPATNSSNSNPAVHSEDNRPLAICVRNLPSRSSDTSLKDGLFHEYKKHGKVTWVKVVGQHSDRYALVCFKKADDVDKALEVSHDKLFFGCKIEVAPYQGYDVEDNEFRPYEAELDEYHPKSTRTLFIGNLEKDITASDLRKHFDCFGEIIEIDIKKQGVNAYAFCQYSDIISVVKAMRQMDGEHLGANRIKLGFGKSMPTNCVWIDGISESVGESYLTAQFNRFGPVSQVASDRERKLALVFFEQIQYAQTAVKEMRGVTLRGRKLQVDFASRECQDAFYDKLEKQGCVGSVAPAPVVSFDVAAVREVTARGFETTVVVPGARFRYDTPRSRTSSFSRHSTLGNSGAMSPSSLAAAITSAVPLTPGSVSGSTTPRGGSSSRRVRYPEQNDACDGLDRRFRNYDEFSQESAASHEDTDRPESPVSSKLGPEPDAVTSRRRSEQSPLEVGLVDDDACSQTGVATTPTSSKQRVLQSVVVAAPVNAISAPLPMLTDTISQAPVISTAANPTGLFPPPDMRNLQKERHQILEQLEECPSSGDELVSPKKRMRFDALTGVGLESSLQTNHLHHIHHPHNPNKPISDSNCDVINSNDPNIRKSVEVRRLSECNNLNKVAAAAAQAASGLPSHHSSIDSTNQLRRPSTECLLNPSPAQTPTRPDQQVITQPNQFQPLIVSKRRKTGSSLSESEHHSSRGRGHQLHSHHSHEASGGESADGSRPGTPLCDERPDHLTAMMPSEPRRLPRDRLYTNEPMYLPLPKFAIQMYHQQRLMNSLSTGGSTHSLFGSSMSSSSANNHSSLSHALSSPPPALLTRPTNQNIVSLTSANQTALHPLSTSTSSNSLMGSFHSIHHSTIEQPPSSPCRAPSLSSNSSDSDAAASTTGSPTIEERIRMLDVMFEKWSGGNSSRKHNFNEFPLSSSLASSSSSYRHRFNDINVNAVPPQSDIAKTLLTRKSIFDDDLKRLENIGDKYEPREFSSISRNVLLSSNTLSPVPTTPVSVTQPASVQVPVPTTPTVTKLPSLHFQTPATMNPLHHTQRLNSASPMNSPQPQSPYNSPTPSPVIVMAPSPVPVAAAVLSHKPVTPNCTKVPAKGLQYPFPSHPPMSSAPTPPPPGASGSIPPQQPPPPPLPSVQVSPQPPPPTTAAPPPPPTPQEAPSPKDIPDPPKEKSQISTKPKTSITATSNSSNPPPSISKSVSVSEKTTIPKIDRQQFHKSASIPGSTNVGTVKSLIKEDPHTSAPTTPGNSAPNSRRGSQEFNFGHTGKFRTTNSTNCASSSSKAEKHNKHATSNTNSTPSKSEMDRKKRTDSLDRRKAVHQSEKQPSEPKEPTTASEPITEAPTSVPSIDSTSEIVPQDRYHEKERKREEEDIRFRRDDERKERKERKERHFKQSCDDKPISSQRYNDHSHSNHHSDDAVDNSSRTLEREKEVLERKLREADEFEKRSTPSSSKANVKPEPMDDTEVSENDVAVINKPHDRYYPKEEPDSFHTDSSISKHNKENSKTSRENTPVLGHVEEHKRKEHTSPNRNMSKRRLSIQDPSEESKRFKYSESRKILDRREFKDPNRSSTNHRHRHHSSSTKSNSATHSKSMEDKIFMSVSVEERIRKDSGFDERRKERHRSKEWDKHQYTSVRNKTSQEAIIENIDRDGGHHDIPVETCFSAELSSFENMIRSSDEDVNLKNKDFFKDKKQQELPLGDHGEYHRQYAGGSDNKHRQDQDKKSSTSSSTSDRRNASTPGSATGNDRHHRSTSVGGSRADNDNSSHTSSTKSSSERRSRLLKVDDSSDDSDSDEPKKHSIFDIPDDAPYISMYDKVKARSCKNMQKQEEEKKIKAKFSQLKQSRAKREEKKRSHSWDEDSDSDADDDDMHRYMEDDDGNQHNLHRRRHHRTDADGDREGEESSSGDEVRASRDSDQPRDKDTFGSDSESEPRRRSYHQNRVKELCDGDSSDGSSLHNHQSRRKIISRKNSHSTRVAFDSSDDEAGTSRRMENVKQEPRSDSQPFEIEIKSDVKQEKLDDVAKADIEDVFIDSKQLDATKVKSFNKDSIKLEIKTEPLDPCDSQIPSALAEKNMPTSEHPRRSSSTIDSKEAIYEHLFSPESRKKHKKNKKRQREILTSRSLSTETETKIKVESTVSGGSSEAVFDELKRELSDGASNYEKRKHTSRKEKRREKSKDEHERTREERYRLKKLKRQAKLSSTSSITSTIDSQDQSSSSKPCTPVTATSASASGSIENPAPGTSTTSILCNTNVASVKRGEKMEDIFGPISDDENSQSASADLMKTITHQVQTVNNAKDVSYSDATSSTLTQAASVPDTPGKDLPLHWTGGSKTPIQSLCEKDSINSPSSVIHKNVETTNNKPMPIMKSFSSESKEKQHHREKKKDRKRKEREKIQFRADADENSVDLDAAGRALEAQLMEDCPELPKSDDISPSPTASDAKSADASSVDVFRFSEGEESVDLDKDKKSVSSTATVDNDRHHNRKKKKKRSKEDKHQRHHHHSSRDLPHVPSTSVIQNVTAPPSINNMRQVTPPPVPEQPPPLPPPPPPPHQPDEIKVVSPISSLPKLTIDITPSEKEFTDASRLSLPCLLDDSPPTKNHPALLLSPLNRDPKLISPIPKTPTAPPPTSKLTQDMRKESKNLIPGFGTECTETIHASAVESIAYSSPVKAAPIIEPPSKLSKIQETIVEVKIDEKSAGTAEEKSRVVISQEETEDAVAALLGESFGASDYSDIYEPDPIVDEQQPIVLVLETETNPIIPEEEAEEMRKAVQSLNSEELDMKPDTPQSENDLQIDTDPEDQPDEVVPEPVGLPSLDNPPKTPEVDMSQIRKIAVKPTEKVACTSAPALSVITNTSNVFGTPSASVSSLKSMPAQKPIEPVTKNVIVENRKIIVPAVSPQTTLPTVNKFQSRNSLIFTGQSPTNHPTTTISSPALPNTPRNPIGFIKSTSSVPFNVVPNFEKPTVYPPVLLSPRTSNLTEARLQTPKAPNPQCVIRSGNNQPPETPPSKTINIHPVSVPSNIVLNRMPITPVLAPISSKPVQPSHINLPQPSMAQQSGPKTSAAQSQLQSGQQVPLVTMAAATNDGRPTMLPTNVVKPSLSNVTATSWKTHPIENRPALKSVIETASPRSQYNPTVTNQSIPTSSSALTSTTPKHFQIHTSAQNVVTQSSSAQRTPLSNSIQVKSSLRIITPTNTMQKSPAAASPQNGPVLHSVQRTPVSHAKPYIFEQQNRQISPATPVHKASDSMPLLNEPCEELQPKLMPLTRRFVPEATKTSCSLSTNNIESPKEPETIHRKEPLIKTTDSTSAVMKIAIEPTVEKSMLTEENVTRLTNSSPENNILSERDPVQLDEQDSKEDSDYWSTEVNLESVIKKVDALCSGGEDSADEDLTTAKEDTKQISETVVGSPFINRTEMNKITESAKLIEDELDEGVNLDSKVARTPSKRGRGARGVRKQSPVTLDSKANNNNSTGLDPSGVQTRRTATKPVSKRGRGGRTPVTTKTNATPTSSSTDELRKPRNTNSESDVYEFHEDSGDETSSASPSSNLPTTVLPDANARPRLIMTIKGPNTTSESLAEEVAPKLPTAISAIEPAEEQKSEPISDPTTISPPMILIPNSDPIHSIPSPSPPNTDSPLSSCMIDSPYSQDSKDEFSAPNCANVRKSRRLIERDGSRCTIDDTIEDVVKNLATSPQHQKSNLLATTNYTIPLNQQPTQPTSTIVNQATTSSPILNVASPQQEHQPSLLAQQNPTQPSAQSTSNLTPPRRSTRNTSTTPIPNSGKSISNDKSTGNTALSDIRKSPRANRRAKDRKLSENSIDSSDERSKADDKEFEDSQPTDSMKALLTDMPKTIIHQKASNMETDTVLNAIQTVISKPQTESELTPAQPLHVVVSSVQIPKQIDQVVENKPKELEPLTLIDPVTGELTVVQQCNEGQYVPVQGVRNQLNPFKSGPNSVAGKGPTTIAGMMQQIHHQKQPMVSQSVSVLNPTTAITTITDAPNKSVMSQIENEAVVLHKISTSTTTQSSTTTQQSPIVAQPSVVQIKPPTQRAHPLKAYVLNSQLPKQTKPATLPNQTQLGVVVLQQIPPQPMSNVIKPPVLQQPIPSKAQPQTTPSVLASNIAYPNQAANSAQNLISQTLHVQVAGRVGSPVTHSMTLQGHSPRIQQQIMAQLQKQTSPLQQQQPQQMSQFVPSNLHPTQMHKAQTQQQQQQQSSMMTQQTHPSIPSANKLSEPIPVQYQQGLLQTGKVVQQTQPPIPNNLQHKHLMQTQHQQIPQHTQHVVQSGMPVKPSHMIATGHPVVMQTIKQQSQHSPSSPMQKLSHPPNVTTPQSQTHLVTHATIQTQQSIQQTGGSQHIMSCGTPSLQIPSPVSGVKQPQLIQVAAQHQSPQIRLPNGPMVTNAKTIAVHPQQSVPPPVNVAAQPNQQQPPSAMHLQQQQHTAQIIQQQSPLLQPPKQVAIGLGHQQQQQIMTGAVASPPLKQPHLNASQQPVVTGASSSRVTLPAASPQGVSRLHVMQPGLPVSTFDANMHVELAGGGGFAGHRSQSPPPAHQQVSPLTPGDGSFANLRNSGQREHFMYRAHMQMRAQDMLGQAARSPCILRSPMMPGSVEQKELTSDADEPLATSPPLELRRPPSGPLRATIAVPHSLQSPQDRATDSPQVAQVYVHGNRPLFDAAGRQIIPSSTVAAAEPPPAHRPVSSVTYAGAASHVVVAATASGNIVVSGGQQHPTHSLPPGSVVIPAHLHSSKVQLELQRELFQKREREKELRSSIPCHAAMPNHGSIVPSMGSPIPSGGRTNQLNEPPHASQVPPQADSLLMLLQRYPVMWQGLLALKTDQAAVQMHFVWGNPNVASKSLPCNSDGSTPPLRIAQRMRLEQTQLEGVARKMQIVNEHCMLLALPCGRDHMDVLQQSTNLQTGFITYLQQKKAAGIINIAEPDTDQAAYVVHIFPSCEFANENLAGIAPDLLHRVADIAHLVIVIATV